MPAKEWKDRPAGELMAAVPMAVEIQGEDKAIATMVEEAIRKVAMKVIWLEPKGTWQAMVGAPVMGQVTMEAWKGLA
jgi:hypothetical protein